MIFGITGSIAAYKTLEVIRTVQKQGFEVRVVMTKNGTKLLAPLACQVLTRHKVLIESFDPDETGMHHISLRDWADLLVVAPATANIIGKAAAGIADDLLSTLLLSFEKPILVVPAMDEEMWQNPIVQENVDKLRSKKFQFVLPVAGELASGRIGKGRFPSINRIYYKILSLTEKRASLNNKKVLLTAGRTIEHLDPFRIITNCSSGRMGTMLAYAAISREASLKPIFGEVTYPLPEDVEVIRVSSTQGMEEAVMKEFDQCEIIIMAAAVADYQPKNPSANKIKDQVQQLEIVKTRDILKLAASKKRSNQIFVGFSLETDDPINRGWAKLVDKNLDLIVVNDPASIGRDLSQATLLFKNKQIKELGEITKWELANRILDECLPT